MRTSPTVQSLRSKTRANRGDLLPSVASLLTFAEYAQVVKMLGNGRLEALCFDGEKRLAHIRGKLRKKVWINQGDIILLSLRDYQDEKGDVILKYSADEARSLKAYGELPESAKINETDTYVVNLSSRESIGSSANGWAGMVMRAWMIMSSSTRTGTGAATTKMSMSMRSKKPQSSYENLLAWVNLSLSSNVCEDGQAV